jgi:hypothetical protein
MAKVTKAALVDEAKRVFGGSATVFVDELGDDGFFTCRVSCIQGVRLTAGSSARSTARRRLYSALCALNMAYERTPE